MITGSSSPIILYIFLMYIFALFLSMGVEATFTHFSTNCGIDFSCSVVNFVIIFIEPYFFSLLILQS
jgi:hypothetical protein